MVTKKEMASIGLIPIEANTANGIQSKAVNKYTNLSFWELIQVKAKSFNDWISIRNLNFDILNQLFQLIIGGSHV